ncbi:hypothetical protein BC826DRAFT_1110206 [Russula brevipes]|nr:hypothetical protein BC826DRAFT_1110206 [Russula brevipes]
MLSRLGPILFALPLLLSSSPISRHLPSPSRSSYRFQPSPSASCRPHPLPTLHDPPSPSSHRFLPSSSASSPAPLTSLHLLLPLTSLHLPLPPPPTLTLLPPLPTLLVCFSFHTTVCLPPHHLSPSAAPTLLVSFSSPAASPALILTRPLRLRLRLPLTTHHLSPFHHAHPPCLLLVTRRLSTLSLFPLIPALSSAPSSPPPTPLHPPSPLLPHRRPSLSAPHPLAPPPSSP